MMAAPSDVIAPLASEMQQNQQARPPTDSTLIDIREMMAVPLSMGGLANVGKAQAKLKQPLQVSCNTCRRWIDPIS